MKKRLFGLNLWHVLLSTLLISFFSSPLSAQPVLPHDDFGGTALDVHKWDYAAYGGATLTQDDALIMSMTDVNATSGATVASRWSFLGDFDVQVDFQMAQGWASPASGGHNDVYMGLLFPGGEQFHITRIRFPDGQPYPSYMDEEQLWIWKNSYPYEPARINASAVSGKYRIIREGSTLRFF